MSARSHPSDRSIVGQLQALHEAVATQKTPTKDQVVRFCALMAMLHLGDERTELDNFVLDELQVLSQRIWKHVGISAATKAIFRAHRQEWLTAVEVRDFLVNAGFNLRKYSFPMAVVHSTLKNLNVAGLLELVQKPFDYRRYRWKLE